MTNGANWDVIVIGAGAAGLFCGATTSARGFRTLVVDHFDKPGEKIRISGGGRCNFTNLHTRPECFLSDNPHFAKSALSRYKPEDFLDLMIRHNLTWHEKTLGQLFCDQKSGAIIKLLLNELETAGGTLQLSTNVADLSREADGFSLAIDSKPNKAGSVVIATGGLSIPKIGATGFAYDIARQFGLSVIAPEPALVPLTFDPTRHPMFSSLAGVACRVRAQCHDADFDEAMLFTHKGLSGPAILQASSYWSQGDRITLNLLPEVSFRHEISKWKQGNAKRQVSTLLESFFPKRLADSLGAHLGLPVTSRLADLSNLEINGIEKALSEWVVIPDGTEGWRKAEVTKGGIDTNELSSKTMESRSVPGLYFIGECVDVTGWLGGYNFQWAWASASAAGHAIENRVA